MGLFNGLTRETELNKLENIAVWTIVGYMTRQLEGLRPSDAIPSTEIDLLSLTEGQMISYLFGNDVDVSRSSASASVKKQFEQSVKRHLPRVANEAVHQDTDLARLAFNTLEQKAALLQNKHGSSWQSTDAGTRIAEVLETVFGHEYQKAISSTKYRYIVFATNAKYDQSTSSVDWRAVLTIHNYV